MIRKRWRAAGGALRQSAARKSAGDSGGLACSVHRGFAGKSLWGRAEGQSTFRTAAESRAVKPQRLMNAVGTPV